MQKKYNTGLLQILLLFLCFILMFVMYMQKRERKQYKEVQSLPFYNTPVNTVADGTYPGKVYASFMHLQLKVTVKNHQITEIEIVENVGSKGKNVQPIIDRIIESNSAVVPAIEGEELASLVFISCVDDALRKGVPQNAS